MKRLISILMVMVLLLSALSLGASATNTPSAPNWISAEDYVVFEGDPLYSGSGWNNVLTLRSQVEQATQAEAKELYDRIQWVLPKTESAATCFEAGLLYERMEQKGLYLYEGSNHMQGMMASYMKASAQALVNDGKMPSYISMLWVWRGDAGVRAYTLKRYVSEGKIDSVTDLARTFFGGSKEYSNGVPIWGEFMKYPEFNFEQVTSYRAFDQAKTLPMWPELKNYIFIMLNGAMLFPDTVAEVVNQTTMIPIRSIVEPFHADIDWNAEAQVVTITYAGHHIELTLGEKTAYHNGDAITLAVAPYAENGRTYLPLRFVSEQLGLSVDWTPGVITIEENTSFYQTSNVDDWALGMGSVLAWLNGGDKYKYFGMSKPGEGNRSRSTLKDSWGITDRQALIGQVAAFNAGNGHNAMFKQEAANARSMTAKERADIAAKYSDGYMLEQIYGYDQKWGEIGLIAWDLCRVSSLVQWGYSAGYITLEEALVLMKPAAEQFKTSFSNWDEGMENYSEGYLWWSRTDNRGGNNRLELYKKSKVTNAYLFDDALFQQEIVLDSELTYEQLIAEAR